MKQSVRRNMKRPYKFVDVLEVNPKLSDEDINGRGDEVNETQHKEVKT